MVRCAVRFVWVLLVCPEDLGGDAETGPASIWDLQEVRALDGVTEIQRGPEFHCQLASSNQHRPLGPYTNLASLLSRMHRDWPSQDPMHGFHAALRQPPYHPLTCAPWCSLHSGEWTRVRSSTSLLPQLWVNIFARTVLVAVAPFLQPEHASHL